ncbi:TPA: hypothetical protein SMI12_001054 [Serratia liquefaciens]|nr:hypothetical protein [Serratia liquefaciens]
MNLFLLDTAKVPSDAGILARKEGVVVVKRQEKKPHSGGGVLFDIGAEWR